MIGKTFGLVVFVVLCCSGSALAGPSGWSAAVANRKSVDLKGVDLPALIAPSAAQAAATPEAALVGTWRIFIEQSKGGLPPFQAYHTFNADGTFTEVSNLLSYLNETPSKGVWNYDGLYNLTFELFAFNPDKTPAGVIRVRCKIQLVKIQQYELVGEAAVDFIDLDGGVSLEIDSARLLGQRVRVVPR